MGAISKVLALEIEANTPDYDEEGNPIIDESLDMLPEPTYLKGIFMADLLEDEENSQKTSSS